LDENPEILLPTNIELYLELTKENKPDVGQAGNYTPQRFFED
jgi:hypothetical protein